MKKTLLTAVCMLLLCAGQSMARDISFDPNTTTQDAFRTASKEVGMGLAFKNAAPTLNLGITGFEAGVEVSLVDVKKDSAAFSNDAPSFLALPKIRVRKGLPLGIDVGAMYSNIGNTDIQLYGVEVAKAIIEGDMTTPAIGVRGTYTKLTGVSQLELQTAGIDASISKGLLIFTPYAGAGLVWIDSKYTGPKVGNLVNISREKIWQPRYFAGLEVKPFPFFRVLAEVEYALRPIYTAKVAIGF